MPGRINEGKEGHPTGTRPKKSFSEELSVSGREKKHKPKELGVLHPIATRPLNRRSMFTAEP